MEKVESLADFVRRIMKEKNLSTYDVQKASGRAITAATVSKIVNGDIRSNSLATLRGLAWGLDVPEQDVINIASGIPPGPSRFNMYADRFDAHDLETNEWEMLEEFFADHVKMMQRYKSEREEYLATQRRYEEMLDKRQPKPLAPVVATIQPAKPKLIDQDEIEEIEKRIKPRRKAS